MYFATSWRTIDVFGCKRVVMHSNGGPEPQDRLECIKNVQTNFSNPNLVTQSASVLPICMISVHMYPWFL